mmetsp:Transcript_81340/g.235150  ORF Transcript_81340/g.235150 Transcript_81340/m.235150 type:complete len:234 (-) Transcript_81340:242-943(-)
MLRGEILRYRGHYRRRCRSRRDHPGRRLRQPFRRALHGTHRLHLGLPRLPVPVRLVPLGRRQLGLLPLPWHRRLRRNVPHRNLRQGGRRALRRGVPSLGRSDLRGGCHRHVFGHHDQDHLQALEPLHHIPRGLASGAWRPGRRFAWRLRLRRQPRFPEQVRQPQGELDGEHQPQQGRRRDRRDRRRHWQHRRLRLWRVRFGGAVTRSCDSARVVGALGRDRGATHGRIGCIGN